MFLRDTMIITLDTLTNLANTKTIFLLIVVAAVLTWRTRNRTRRVFLVDFACYKPTKSQARTLAEVMRQARSTHYNFSTKTLDFMEETMKRSGLGDVTFFPEGMFRVPPNLSFPEARREARAVMFGAVEELLGKTGVRGGDIGIVIVNCTIFSPVPSLAAMIVNRFELGEGVRSYNLQGMGCTASLSAVGLAKHLLQVHENTYALIVSTENITENCYQGDNRSMIIVNSIFRVGGAAVLLSNRPSDHSSAKYELIHTVHTTTASSDVSYNCIYRAEDSEGAVGVTITKDLIAVADQAIDANITDLGRMILPFPEKLLYFTNHLLRYLNLTDSKPYVPDFMKVIDHLFPHVGAKPVLDGLQRSLKLTDLHMEASRMTLYRFGNTSSSSTWYEIAYAEAKGRMKCGDRVWQMAFGSGFKCSSVIWKSIKNVNREEEINPWTDEIDMFPINLTKIGSFPYHFEEPKKYA